MQMGELRINDYASIEDLNVRYIEKYLNILGNPELNDILKKKGIIKEESGLVYLTLLGTIFFAKDPQSYYPNLVIEASFSDEVYFENLNNLVLPKKSKIIKGTIMEVLEKGLDFVYDSLNEINPKFKEDAKTYPLVVVEEIIKNALIHRDYSKRTENIPIKMEIYNNCLIIRNPSGNSEFARPNPYLWRLFKEYNLIKNKEKGLDKVRSCLQDKNLPDVEVINTNKEYTAILWLTNQKMQINGSFVDATLSFTPLKEDLLSYAGTTSISKN